MIRTVHIGLGPIGLAVAKQAATRHGFEVVGAVDIDPAQVGRDLGEVLGQSPLGVTIASDIATVLSEAKADVAVLCTSSSLARVLPQIEAVLQHRVPLVSTTEELSYPVGDNRFLAEHLNEKAVASGVAVLGTGINPGFAMDALPIMLTAPCERVDRIEVHRVQDARIRRLPFQQKIGAGLTPEEFEAKVQAGGVRHVGLSESVAMIADAMGWTLDRITDEIAPQIAQHTVSSHFLTVQAGQVCGLIQEGKGWSGDEALITLRMEAYLGAPKSYEWIRIHGQPDLETTIPGGVPGDVATASMVMNVIPKVIEARPGLRTMRDIAIPSYYSGSVRHWSEG